MRMPDSEAWARLFTSRYKMPPVRLVRDNHRRLWMARGGISDRLPFAHWEERPEKVAGRFVCIPVAGVPQDFFVGQSGRRAYRYFQPMEECVAGAFWAWLEDCQIVKRTIG